MSASKKNATLTVKDTSKMIIHAIDSLKGRKARPDEVRICNFVERKFGLKKTEIMKAINEAVNDGTVLKVKYKDSVSFRNPAKFNTKLMQSHVMKIDGQYTSTGIIKKILRELRSITRSSATGASAKEVTQALHHNCQLLNHEEAHIDAALLRAVEMGSASKLPSGNYVLTVGKRIVPRKTDPDQSSSTSKPVSPEESVDNKSEPSTSTASTKKEAERTAKTPVKKEETSKKLKNNAADSSSSATNQSAAQTNSGAKKRSAPVHIKRGRPFSKRKRFKKSLGPDFIEPSELGLQYLRDTYEPKCDRCNLTSGSNVHGEHEDLLICKDCAFKAHPSCMNYSKELADRSRRSPWQCMECKTCSLCEDSGDGVCMLVCDVCDKGYHMNCLNPPLKEKPNGNWACNDCNDTTEITEKFEQIVELQTQPEEQSEEKTAEKEEVPVKIEVLNQSEPEVPELDAAPQPEPAQEKITEESSAHVTDQKEENCELKNEEKLIIEVDDNEKSTVEQEIEKNLSPNQVVEEAVNNNMQQDELLFTGYPDVIPNPQTWTPDDVETFIRYIGFPEQSHLFKEQEIDGSTLLLMRRSDVLSGFEMKLGPALKIYSHIMRLQKSDF